MGSYISEAQRNVQSIVESLVAAEKCDVRFGLVKYRDHPPQESTFVSEQCDFTSAVGAMRANVDTMSAAGGGDGPEAVCCGLHAALHMAWRPDAVKIVVLIADAPPHGLGEHGDGFPNGCPEGRDPLAIARAMLEAGITVYTVGCEPALGSYRFARDFMVAVADITQGQAIALSSAKLLVDVILGGAREELDLERLMGNIDEEVSEARQQVAAERVSAGLAPEVEETSAEYEQYEVQLSSRVARNMAGKGIKARRVAHDGAMAAPQAAKMAKSAGLDRWRTEVVASEPEPTALCGAAATAAAPVARSRMLGGMSMFGARSAPPPPPAAMAMAEECCAMPPMAPVPCAMPCAAAAPGGYGGGYEAELSAAGGGGGGGYSTGGSKVTTEVGDVSYAQVSRMMKKSAARSTAGKKA
ncbi:hypothetical protein JKP88DRAFT_204275 [Tribonema minus]|uniref:VWFA domain-containing protein n=1 Tax=Tribonema minus TaxID=303371 RepID=A0A835ZDN0_9STRA|nr:hypothetical protein JKP88DRAFT_204275 [Tribonema minus]